ncbi:MAG: hypothetical protein Q4G52_12360 [Clostridia bacterium]|nr:hypothetical protein [Clostridia bacterium]
MHSKGKIVIAVIAVVLIVLIGWTVMKKDKADVSPQATAEPEAMATSAPDSTPPPEPETAAQPQTTEGAPEAASDSIPPSEPETTAEPQATEEAPEDMYEGALAGLTQEQIAEMALAEEAASKELGDSGAEGAVD